MIRTGRIGIRRVGMLHLMNCSRMDGVKVIAAADSSKKALENAKSAGVDRLYTDFPI